MKRFIKKIIRALLCLWVYLLVLIPQVKANEATIIETETTNSKFTLPSAVQCFDSSYYSVTTGFSINVNEVEGVYGHDYYWCDIGSNGVISINLDQITSSNKLYSLALHVGNTNGVVPNNASAIGLGTSTYTANNDIYYGTNKGILWASRVNGPFDLYQPSSSSLLTLKYSTIYVLFNSYTNATSAAIKFNYNSSPGGNQWIFGYELECLGDSTGLSSSDIEQVISGSGLATASSVEEVEQSVAEVKEEITELNEQQQVTNEKLDKVDESINSIETPEVGFDDVEVSSDEPISDLLTMPLTLVTAYYDAVTGTCTNYTLPFFYGENITFKCFTIGDYVGSAVERVIDMAICLFMVYEMALLFIRMFDGMTTLSDTYTWIVKRGG